MPIQDKMMRGGTTLRKIIADHLMSKVPEAIDIMISQNNDLNSLLLPHPKEYNSTDPTETDVYPFMGAFVTGSDKWERIGVEPSGALEYDAQYETTIFVTATTANLGLDESGLPRYEQPYRNSAIRMRDDLMAVLTDVILNWPSLGTANSRYRAKVNEDSFRASYPEPLQKSNSANPVWICSGLLIVNINLIETTVVPYIGHVATTNGILELLP